MIAATAFLKHFNASNIKLWGHFGSCLKHIQFWRAVLEGILHKDITLAGIVINLQIQLAFLYRLGNS
jgi:hypothetical protein